MEKFCPYTHIMRQGRLIISIMLLFIFNEFLIAQAISFFIISLSYFIWIVISRPYESCLDNIREIFMELAIFFLHITFLGIAIYSNNNSYRIYLDFFAFLIMLSCVMIEMIFLLISIVIKSISLVKVYINSKDSKKPIKFKIYNYKIDMLNKLKNQKSENSLRKKEISKRKSKSESKSKSKSKPRSKFAAPLHAVRVNTNCITNTVLSLENNPLPTIPEEKMTPRFRNKIEEEEEEEEEEIKTKEEIKEINLNNQNLFFNNKCLEVNLYDRSLDFEKILNDNFEANPKSLIIHKNQNPWHNSNQEQNFQSQLGALEKNEYLNLKLKNNVSSSFPETQGKLSKNVVNIGRKAEKKEDNIFDEICYPNQYSQYPNMNSNNIEKSRYSNYDNYPKRQVIQVLAKGQLQSSNSEDSYSNFQHINRGFNQNVWDLQNDDSTKNQDAFNTFKNSKQIFKLSKEDVKTSINPLITPNRNYYPNEFSSKSYQFDDNKIIEMENQFKQDLAKNKALNEALNETNNWNKFSFMQKKY